MKSLQAKFKTFAQYVEKSSTILLITDVEGMVVYANKAIEEKTGYTVAEIVGKKCSYKQFLNIVELQKMPSVGRVCAFTKSGKYYQMNLYTVPLLDTKKNIKYFVGIVPALESVSFVREFMSIFSPVHLYSSSVCTYFLKNFAPSKQINFDINFITLLERSLIKPERKKFIEREVDALLIQNAQCDTEAFHVLYTKYSQFILNYFLRRTSNFSTAEDLTQETFILGFTHLQNFSITNASYQSYLFRLAHNVLVSFYRREHKNISIDENEYFDRGSVNSVDQYVFEKEIWSCMKKYVSDIEARVLLLYYKKEKSVKEISQMLGKSENAIKLYLSRSRKKLIHPFTDEGFL